MNLKNLLPFENYVLKTRLSPEEVLKRIDDNIQQNPDTGFFIFSQNYSKPYTGQIIGNSFAMRRNINYRNSFLPVIKGQVTTFVGQTQVNIKMRPETIVLIFISIWLGIAGLVCIVILLIGILELKQVLKNGISPELLIPFGMLVFGCLLTHFAFKIESKKSKEFLATLLQSIDTK